MASADSDIDYIRRYGDNPNAPSIAPLPAPEVATPASTSVERVNAAARATALPGVGTVGSTPETDATNLNLAASMERADLGTRFGFGSPEYQQGTETSAPVRTVASTAMDEYGQQRRVIDQERREVMAKLGIIPPHEAGFAAVVMANPRERRTLLENLHVLEDQSNQLLREHHYSAIENARQSHEDLARQTHIQVSTGIAKMAGVISQANQKYGVGSAGAKAAIIDAYSGDDPDISAARGTKTFEDKIKPYTDMHDLSEERARFVKAFGREPTSVETTATGGVNLRAGEEKAAEVPSKVLENYSGLKSQRAEQQAYLDAEVRPALKPPLQKKIGVIDAKLRAYETQFPQLAPRQTANGTAPTGQVEPAATPTTVATKADFDALPKGAHFLFNGKLGTKH